MSARLRLVQPVVRSYAATALPPCPKSYPWGAALINWLLRITMQSNTVNRQFRTIQLESAKLIGQAVPILLRLLPSDTEETIKEKYLGPMLRDQSTDGDKVLGEAIEHEEDGNHGSAQALIVLAAMAYATQAGRAAENGMVHAWTYLLDGSTIISRLQGADLTADGEPLTPTRILGRALSDEEEAKAVAFWKKVRSVKKTAEQFGVSRPTIDNALKRAGIQGGGAPT